TLGPRFQELKVIEDDPELFTLLPILTSPLVQPEMSFDEELVALSHVLFHQVGKAATSLATVKGLHFQEDRHIFPLSSLRVLAAVVDRKAERCHFTSRGKRSYLRIPRQTANQHHFI